MYINKYCKYKKQNVSINENSAMCVCANCENDACVARRDDGVRYTYSTCQEYLMSKLDNEYNRVKERQCRICLEISKRANQK